MELSGFTTGSREGLEPTFWLFVRLILGVEWVRAGWEKIGDAGWTSAPQGAAVEGFLRGALDKASTEAAHPEVQQWFADAVDRFFLPNTELIAYLVAYGELLVGIALIVGFLTRLSTLLAVVMNLAFLFAGTTSSNPQMLLLGLAIVLIGKNAGLFGIDGWVLPWLRERGGETTTRAAQVATIGVALFVSLWLTWISADTRTWFIGIVIAGLAAAAVWLAHIEIPASRIPPRSCAATNCSREGGG
jgi:thiosulfate dehydrogenase (quinone) large subunit